MIASARAALAHRERARPRAAAEPAAPPAGVPRGPAAPRLVLRAGRAPAAAPKGRITSLIGARVLIWGFGEIGQNLAPTLKALGAEVRGVARSAGTRAGFEVIADDQVRSAARDRCADRHPARHRADRRDHRTRGARALPDHAVLINVGRGATVDQVALREALEAGTLGSAGIDVTEPEPLPRGSAVGCAATADHAPRGRWPAGGGRRADHREPARPGRGRTAAARGGPLSGAATRSGVRSPG